MLNEIAGSLRSCLVRELEMVGQEGCGQQERLGLIDRLEEWVDLLKGRDARGAGMRRADELARREWEVKVLALTLLEMRISEGISEDCPLSDLTAFNCLRTALLKATDAHPQLLQPWLEAQLGLAYPRPEYEAYFRQFVEGVSFQI
jgi:hypothetical protein